MRAWVILAAAATLVAVAAAAARRTDQDFEFDDEAEASGTAEATHTRRPRRYIYDPHNSLCQSLVCKRREVCLLRDAFTALCANKKEILRKGDVIVAATTSNTDEVEDSGAGWGRADDEDVFYDAAASADQDTAGQGDQDDDDAPDRCVGCPVRARASFLCGSDNRTYSSLCRLDLHNCVRRSARPVRLACRGFCPCAHDAPAHRAHAHVTRPPPRRPQRRMRARQRADRRSFDDLEYDELWRRRKPDQTEHNEVLPERPARRRQSQGSEGCALDKMANRLLDWFSVLMEEAGATTAPDKGFPSDCKPEVRWMFAHLDTDGDGILSLTNLYSLRHDDREKCLRPFLSSCSRDGGSDGGLSRASWCSCLRRAARPCAALARAHPAPRPGAYVPACDARGFYRPRQCHAALGVCWCVDAHGAELPGTRTKGAPACPPRNRVRPDTSVARVSAPGVLEGAPADDEDGGGSGDAELRF